MNPIAIFRFSPTEGPAYFAEWLGARALPWQLIPVDEGAPIPADPREFSGIGMMGGPMSATDRLPWIEPLSRLLRDAIVQEVPLIGHCLGAQLLAQALGARVSRSSVPEIGWVDVEVSDAGAGRSWFGGRERLTIFQWHYEVFDLPAGATRVLTNAFNPNQAFIVDDRHIGLQCHVEMTRDLVESWCESGLGETAGPGTAACQSRQDILAATRERLPALHAVADGVYARWAEGLLR